MPLSIFSPLRSAAPDDVVATILSVHGLDAAAYSSAFVARSIERRREATGQSTKSAYLELLRRDRAEAEVLFHSLRVCYSEFFRDPLACALLETRILPALAQQRARAGGEELRVWSAGCAAGQEAWSMAISLDELSTTLQRPVPYRTFATDSCAAELERARAGVYGPAAVGNLRVRQLRACFSPQGESFTIVPRLRERVDFSAYELLDECTSCPPASIYGDIDVVLCCNVLMYYAPAAQQVILEKLISCLAADGYLIVGGSERQIARGCSSLRAAAPYAAVFRTTAGRS